MQEIIYILIIVVSIFLILSLTKLASDLVLMGAMTSLLLLGILTPSEALEGFSSTSVVLIATMYIVVASLKETGAVQFITKVLLYDHLGPKKAMLNLLFSTASLSAFMNNTAVVAMMIPIVQIWSVRIKKSPAKFLIPLSYASILGGTITLIGTSTNLVINGLMIKELNRSIGLFELAVVGVPLSIVGGLFMVFFGEKLLPNNKEILNQNIHEKKYGVEVKLNASSPQVGKSIQEAGLRNLRFTYLYHIERDGQQISDVSPNTVLLDGDVLTFIGAAEGANELRNTKGLQPADEDVKKLNIEDSKRQLVEVVVGQNFPSIGKSIKESAFRTHYKSVIISVYRAGNRIEGKIGDIRFEVGDTLLLEADSSFVEHYRYRTDFLLVSMLDESTLPDWKKAPIAISLLLLMVFLTTFGILDILVAALVCSGGMLLTGCISFSKAKNSIDLGVLITIGASFSIGYAISKTGAAMMIGESVLLLIGGFGDHPWLALSAVYFMTTITTELITNNAAAILMFPIAVSISNQLNLNSLPFIMAVLFAASFSFVSPLGYQTNMMVYSVGGYRIRDFLRMGIPLSVLCGVTSVILIPYFWKF